MIVAAQPDPAAPFVSVAAYNIIAGPAEFAGALLKETRPRLTRPQAPALPRATHLTNQCVARLLTALKCSCQCLCDCARIAPKAAS